MVLKELMPDNNMMWTAPIRILPLLTEVRYFTNDHDWLDNDDDDDVANDATSATVSDVSIVRFT